MTTRSFVDSTAVLLISAASFIAAPALVLAQADGPMVKVNIEGVRTDLASEFNTDDAELVTEIELPVEVAAAACGSDAAQLSTQAAGGSATCTASSLTPEFIEFLRTTQDAEGDEIPDILLAPGDAPA